MFWAGRKELPMSLGGRPVRGHRKSAQPGMQEVMTAPAPFCCPGNRGLLPLPPHHACPEVNQLTPCLVLCSQRLSHYLGIYVSVTVKDDCPRFPLGGAWPALELSRVGGGAILLGAGWGFNFRGICNQWGAALGTWWLWAILGGKRLAPLGEGSWQTCSSLQ